jgi:hypothetical protein
MIQVKIAVPTTDGHSEVTTFEYDDDEFSDPRTDDDFLVLIAGDTKGHAYVDILAFVFEKDEYTYAEDLYSGHPLHQTISSDLSDYLLDRMYERAASDDNDSRIVQFPR